MKNDLDEELKDVFMDDYGNWEVKDDGEIIYHGSAIGPRNILPNGLDRSNLTHMLSKVWDKHPKDAIDYYFAYLKALRNAGYKSLSIDLTNIHEFKLEK